MMAGGLGQSRRDAGEDIAAGRDAGAHLRSGESLDQDATSVGI